jgi:hypothetical protein
MHKKARGLCRFVCKSCRVEKLVYGGSAHFVCDDCKPSNHFTFSEQYKAQKTVAKAKKDGQLKPATDFDCVDCGNPAIEYDHRDYSKPLQVDPVCRGCNVRRGPAVGWDRRMFARHL